MTKYIFNWGAEYPLFVAETSSKRLRIAKKLLGDSVKKATILFDGKEVSCYHLDDPERERKASKEYLRLKFISKLLELSRQSQETYWCLSQKVMSINFSSCSNQELAAIYREVNDSFPTLYGLFELSRPEYIVLVEEKVKSSVSKVQLNILLEPVEYDEIMKEQHQWLNFCMTKRSEDELLDYALKNVWILGGITDRNSILEFMKKRYSEVQKLNSEEIKKKIEDSTKSIEENKKAQEELLNETNNAELSSSVRTLHLLSIDRSKIKKCCGDAWYLQNKLLAEISVRTSVPLNDLQSYKLEEVLNLLNGQKLSDDKLAMRKECYVFIYDNEDVFFFEGENAKTQIAPILKQIEETKDLKGSIAFPGKIIGKVVVVPISDLESLSKNISEFKKGDILVTQMTQPNMTVLMEKAGAVVTDEGGITSHAAVVSREFKIPCIVGTGLATKKLKTGDLVEVDAEKGTVKKVEETVIDKSKEYQRLFRVQGLRYLINDVWMNHYKSLHTLTVVINDYYTSYLPKEIVQKTLNDGLALLSSKELFEDYKKDFSEFMIRALNDSKSLVSQETLDKKEVEEFFEMIKEFYSFYSKAEFFYTDKAFIEFSKNNDLVLGENLKQMGALKCRGREALNEIFFGEEASLNQVMGKLGDQFGVSFEEIQQYGMEEIFDLFDGKKVDSEVIRGRDKAFFFVGDGNSVSTLSGEEAESIINDFVDEKISCGNEIKGTVANKGRIIGKAKVIVSGYDNYDQLSKVMEEMNDGDILMSETTSPELMVACNKAGAIITDQGGLLSHAAVISRERGIPCIVATEYATRVFKDGDLVEVDANTGVVKKI